jgi:hypothetical protein
MIPVLLVALLIGGFSGWVWGRISARMPLPELLRMLTAPVFSGVVGLVAVLLFVAVQGGSGFLVAPRAAIVSEDRGRVERVGSGFGLIVRTGFGGGFLLGGLPSVLGWLIGYRRRPPR